MKPLSQLKFGFRAFANDQPGQRFINLFRRIQQLGSRPLVLAVSVIVGVLLMVAGLLLGLVPGVPGIVLGLLGVALIAAQFNFSARACDTTELASRRALRRIRGAKSTTASQSSQLPPSVIKPAIVANRKP